MPDSGLVAGVGMKQNEGSSDTEALRALNLRVGEAENAGDRTWLASVLAPRLAFQRADPARSVDDADAYLAKVKAGGDRETRIVEPITVFGDRAVVQCVVTSGGVEYHNLRLFIRREGEWKLLAWANEPV